MDRAVYERMRALEAGHWWFQARRDILAGVLDDLPLPKTARVLEVGCGPGGNLAMLSRYGETVGLEPDEETRAYAAAATGRPVCGGRLPDETPFPPASFDLVAALDVIEHVSDDAACVAGLRDLLKPGGFLLATVPAHAWMWSRHDELHHHQRRYAPDAFRRLIEGAGLQVRLYTPFNSVLFPLIAGVRVAKTALRRVDGDEEAIPAPWLNAALRTLFASERPLARRGALPFGVSLLAVAERPVSSRATLN